MHSFAPKSYKKEGPRKLCIADIAFKTSPDYPYLILLIPDSLDDNALAVCELNSVRHGKQYRVFGTLEALRLSVRWNLLRGFESNELANIFTGDLFQGEQDE